MKVKATVLCENYVMWNRRLLGEHGFSVYVKTEHGNFLFDTGTGTTILNNAGVLGFDLKALKGIILSHNHGDHTGGLLPVLEVKEGLDIYSHPNLFTETYGLNSGRYIFIGMPYARGALESKKVKFNFSKEFKEIVPGLWQTGEIPRTTDYEPSQLNQLNNENQWIKTEKGFAVDYIMDDQSIVLETEKGLIVVLGCCHAGIINTLSYVVEKMGTRHFYAVIGGTHLASATEDTKEKSMNALCEFDIEHFGISHCSGVEMMAPLTEKLGNKVFYCHVGAVVEV